MCSISGAFVIERGGIINPHHLKEIISNAQERGRDSSGLYLDGKLYTSFKKDTIPSFPLGKDYHAVAINNNRAEPTTEYVKEKTIHDVQPFVTDRFVIAHNGTISNDLDLIKKYGLKRNTTIDSAVIAPLLEALWDGSIKSLRNILKDEIIGSYALAIWEIQTETLYLAVNYKPLFLEFRFDGVIYFSSLEDYLHQSSDPNEIFVRSKIWQLPPYSLLRLKQGDLLENYSLWKTSPEKDKKVLVICSGGLDSVVVATQLKKQGYEVTLLYFMYGCRAEKKEIIAVTKIAEYLNIPVMFVPTDIFTKVIGHSRLTNTKEELVTERKGEASAELAWEWVPARNLIMYSVATGIAEGHGYRYIALGNNLEESGAYADNEMIFASRFSDILPHATNLQNRVEMLQPVGNLMKHEIVKLGLEIGAPLHLTWSCYNDREHHCGVCGPCYMRRKAFQINGMEEIIKYEQ